MLVLAPAVGWAAPGTGLAGTHHDFSGKTVTSNGELWTTGLCTYCHTPHKAITTALLWNHTLSVNNFSWDIPKTTAGTNFPTFKGDIYNGPTAKCLSCHDGSVAIGDIAWFGEGNPSFNAAEKHGAGDMFNVGFEGNMKGNHPVAMPYPYGGGASTYNGTTNGFLPTDEWVATPASPIRLFKQDGSGNVTAGAVAGSTGIECSSCHDPHNKAAVDDLFLRGKLSGNTQGDGYLCLQCHIK
jgi:hypothetical protein